MQWYVYLAHLLGGAFVANALPHLIAGISGRPLQSPFASPPFIGLSSPTVNVAWALVNLALAYLLLVRVGPLDLRDWPDAGACFGGFALMALQCARSLHRLRRGAVASLVLLVAAQAPAAAQGQEPRRFADAHVHLNDPATWLSLMDEAGIDRTIALAGRDIDNAALLAVGRRSAGRILPFVSVSPEHRAFRPAWEADDERLAQLVDSLLTLGGYFGIGEISVSHFPGAGFPEADFDPNGRTMRSLFQVARKHRVPVMVHVEVTRLRELEAVLRDFRDVTVIWAHGGYTPLFLAKRMLETHPNLVYELSARTWTRHPRSPDYTIFQDDTTVWREWLALVEAMPTRFLVGTDASVRSPRDDRDKVRRVHLFLGQLTDSTRRLVAQDNVAAILRLGDK